MDPRRDTYVVGYYKEARDAGRATYALVERGFAKDRIQVLSSVPYPHGAFATAQAPSWIPAFSALGGIGGIMVGLAFAAGTALLYPLTTGGKPVVAWPTVGVITYEFMMLSAILLTVLAFLFFARLPRVR
ncbi:MAG: quinol:electron acceptor oxidoreductase subunit ActD, partial [Chloroflexota bacterium]